MARGACVGFAFVFSVKIFLSKIERNGDRVGIGGDSVNFLLFVSDIAGFDRNGGVAVFFSGAEIPVGVRELGFAGNMAKKGCVLCVKRGSGWVFAVLCGFVVFSSFLLIVWQIIGNFKPKQVKIHILCYA